MKQRSICIILCVFCAPLKSKFFFSIIAFEFESKEKQKRQITFHITFVRRIFLLGKIVKKHKIHKKKIFFPLVYVYLTKHSCHTCTSTIERQKMNFPSSNSYIFYHKNAHLYFFLIQ